MVAFICIQLVNSIVLPIFESTMFVCLSGPTCQLQTQLISEFVAGLSF